MKTNHRITELRRRLDESKIEVIIVTSLLNIRYLTGFTGSAAFLLLGSSKQSKDMAGILLTDSRYAEQARLQLADSEAGVEAVIGNQSTNLERAKLYVNDSANIVIEGGSTSITEFNRWKSLLERSIVPSAIRVEELRQIKDEDELSAIRRACQIADEALNYVLPKLGSKPTEIEFAAELEFRMRMLGADGPSFDTIVASGPNSAMPHARPTERKIVEGDSVVIDFGAVWDGYHSDCTRTYHIGDTPTSKFKQIYDSVLASQLSGSALVMAGSAASRVDNACRNSLNSAGLDEFFTHSTGHGVGLEVHELPWIHSESTSMLAVGEALTVEPGVYLPGELGVRIEDTIAITPSGSECLTKLAKSPYIL